MFVSVCVRSFVCDSILVLLYQRSLLLASFSTNWNCLNSIQNCDRSLDGYIKLEWKPLSLSQESLVRISLAFSTIVSFISFWYSFLCICVFTLFELEFEFELEAQQPCLIGKLFSSILALEKIRLNTKCIMFEQHTVFGSLLHCRPKCGNVPNNGYSVSLIWCTMKRASQFRKRQLQYIHLSQLAQFAHSCFGQRDITKLSRV